MLYFLVFFAAINLLKMNGRMARLSVRAFQSRPIGCNLIFFLSFPVLGNDAGFEWSPCGALQWDDLACSLRGTACSATFSPLIPLRSSPRVVLSGCSGRFLVLS